MRNLRIIIIFFIVAGTSFNAHCQTRKDSAYTHRYFNLFQEYEYTDPAKARVYVDSGLYYAKRTKSDQLIGKGYMYMGWLYQDLSQFNKSNDYFYKSLAYLKRAGDQQGVADAYGNIGNSYLDLHEFRKSLDYQLLSLETNENIIRSKKATEIERQNAEIGRTYALHNIGDIYQEIGMYEKALEYEWRSVHYELEPNNLEGVGISYTTLATIHKEMGHVDSAKYYFDKAIELFESDEVDAPYNYAIALHEYSTMKDAQLSDNDRDEMLMQVLSIRDEIGDIDGIVKVYLDIAEFKFDDLTTDSLSELLENSYHLITESGDELDHHQEQYFRVYSHYNSKIGKYNKAYFALSNYLELKAVSDEKRRTHDLIAKDIRFELETKHFNDSLMIENSFAQERAKHNEEITRIQNIVYLSVIGFIILIVTLILIIGANRRRKKVNLMLSEKNELIEEQKAIVEEKNESISDSINYAKRLQSAILPTKEQINRFFPKSFLFFRPKDVVSGDFYWFETIGNDHFVAVADCTGHGVPGAMVSVVCSNALNRSLNEFELRNTNEILDKTRDIVIETIGKSGQGVADGMDIALVRIQKSEKRIQFSGAHNSLWIVRPINRINHEELDIETGSIGLVEIKGDKQPVGLFTQMKPFTLHEFHYEQGDRIFMTSDGYADQFGGDDGKKYKSRPLKRYLMEIQQLKMDEQGGMLEANYENWRGDYEQIDDVCFFGIELS